jgi:hypothetical protein
MFAVPRPTCDLADLSKDRKNIFGQEKTWSCQENFAGPVRVLRFFIV